MYHQLSLGGEMKTCKRCGNEIPETKRSDSLYCSKSCSSAERTKRYRDRQREADEIPSSTKHGRRNHPAKWMTNIKARASKRGLDFDLTIEDFQMPTHCPLLGIKLEVGRGGHSGNSPTMDRYDSDLGYVKGNVWIISFLANVMKNEATLEQAKLLVENWEKEDARRRTVD